MSNKKSQVSQYKTWVEVDAVALRHNFRAIQKHVGKHVAVMAIVKSNAYGHGLCEVAQQICGSRTSADFDAEVRLPQVWFGVDSTDEALVLKKAGIKNKILILGYIPKQRLSDAIRNGFRFSLYDIDVLKESSRIAKNMRKKAYVHLKLETGTHRQGIMPDELASFAVLLKKYPRVVAEGAYTHFADTENNSSLFYKQQLVVFEKGISFLAEFGIRPVLLHTAASAALLQYPETHINMARLGISLYGLYPSEEIQRNVSRTISLKPALCWKARVAQVKNVPKGSTIGYDRAFTALEPMKIAVIPVGYWDGYDRRLSSKGTIIIKGKRASVVGNVCMNMIMVEVTGIAGIKAGDEVVLLGRQGSCEVTAEEIAAKAGTIHYEILSRINPFIPRVVI